MEMNFSAFLPVVAAMHGRRPAVSVGRQLFCCYAELHDRVCGLAASYGARFGLQKGDRVALAMRNSPQYFEILLACWHAGIVAVPMNSKLHPKEMAYILDHAEARLCFVSEDLKEGVVALRGEVSMLAHVVCVDDVDYEPLVRFESSPMVATDEDDPAWLFYTSGTTGRPKGATLSHRNLLAQALRYYADISQVDQTHCYFHAAPLSHGGGMYGLPHMMKGSHQVIPESRGFDVDEIFDLLNVYDKATFFAAPTMLTRMTNHPRAATAKVASIDTIYYGGAPMYIEDLKRAIQRFGPCLYQIFGQGESPMTGVGLSKALHVDFANPKYEQRLASTGVARTGVQVRVVDADDKEVPPGELGEVLFRSDVNMLGYWKDPEATEKTLRGGWVHTGDIGFADEDGFITLKDRSKDMIISGGTNIYPREIEEVLMTDPRVLEVSVVGRPHHDWGEEVVAFLVAHAGQQITERELDQLCLNNIARFKRPKAYFFVDSLPKNNYGKVLKRTLREQLAAMATQTTTPDDKTGHNFTWRSHMKTRNIGASGLEVSALGLGCMGMSEFYGETDDAQSLSTLEHAFAKGVTLFDTADTYGIGHNEELLGKFLKGKRDGVVVATKFGIVRKPGAYERRVDNSPDYIRSACEASLRRLGVETIDLYYIHRLNLETPLEDSIGTLAELVKQGKVRAIGLSEVSPQTLRRAAALHPIAAVQSEYSLWTRDPEEGVLQACREVGASFCAYSPLGRGFLTGKITSDASLDAKDVRRSNPRFVEENLQHNLRIVDTVRQLAAEKNCTPAQLALAWLLAQGDDIIPIPGTRRIGYLDENLGALDVALTQQELDRIGVALPLGVATGERYTTEGMKGLAL